MRRVAARERGSATVLAVLGLVVVVVLAVVAAGWVAGVAVRHRAGSAADLAAVAAAQTWVRGGTPCPVAHAVARQNGATLVGCRTHDGAVWTRVEAAVTVRVVGREIPLVSRREAWAGPTSDATVHRRAGPTAA